MDLTEVCYGNVRYNGFPCNLNTPHGPKRRLNLAPGVDNDLRPEPRLGPIANALLLSRTCSLVQRHRLYPRAVWGSRNVE